MKLIYFRSLKFRSHVLSLSGGIIGNKYGGKKKKKGLGESVTNVLYKFTKYASIIKGKFIKYTKRI